MVRKYKRSLSVEKPAPDPAWQLLGCADSTHIPGETDGGAQDTGRIVQTAATFKDQAGVGTPSASEGPHRSYVAELHKQTATAALAPPTFLWGPE